MLDLRHLPTTVIVALVCLLGAFGCANTDFKSGCADEPTTCEDYVVEDSSIAEGGGDTGSVDTRPSDGRADGEMGGDTDSTIDSGRDADAVGSDADADSAPTDGDVGGDSCTPITCPATACGTIDNGCGGTVDCPGCVAPKVCDGTSHTCVCKPLTACPAGAECGSVPDGCGGALTCPSCTGGKTCNTATNKCETGCTPATTCPAGKCGNIDNGCGTGMITCPGCTLPATCAGGGTANVCGCTPTGSCGSRVCGTVPDGCGSTVTCGTLVGACPSGLSCNAAGACICIPTGSCGSRVCGTVPDGCGGNITCGPGTRACYDGPGGTSGVGICASGTQTCTSGSWPSSCPGEVLPATETCNGVDDNCDGTKDNGIASRSCYGGPAGTMGVGVCRGGTQSCVVGGTGTWGTCVGEVVPSDFHTVADTATGSWDWNCNGAVDRLFGTGAGVCSFTGSGASKHCKTTNGWIGAVPGCGASGGYLDDCADNMSPPTICNTTTSTPTEQCR